MFDKFETKNQKQKNNKKERKIRPLKKDKPQRTSEKYDDEEV